HHLAGLLEIEAIEWFVHQQHGMRCQQTDRPDEPAGETLRQGTHALTADGAKFDGTHDLIQLSCCASVDARKESQHPLDILITVRPHAVGEIEDQVAPATLRRTMPANLAVVIGKNAGYGLEQSRLPGAI